MDTFERDSVKKAGDDGVAVGTDLVGIVIWVQPRVLVAKARVLTHFDAATWSKPAPCGDEVLDGDDEKGETFARLLL
jgi:hypothetical protein